MPTTQTPAQIRTALLACTTEAAAAAYLAGLKLKAAEIKAVAAALEVPSVGTKARITAALVRVFVGGRLVTAAVRF